MFHHLIKVFVDDWHPCLKPKGLGANWLAQYADIITNKDGWNRIPSIIPPTLIRFEDQPEEPYDLCLDEEDEQTEGGSTLVLDPDAELNEDFLQIFVK